MKRRVFEQIPFGAFYGLGFLMMTYAFLLDTPADIWAGFGRIMFAPSNLLSDYMEIGGLGAAFFNAGLLTVLTVFGVKRSGARATGAVTAAIITVAGFSFFGKNLVNTLPIPIGVWLYAKHQKTPFSNLVHIGLFGTGLAPIVSEIIFDFGLAYWAAIPLGLGVGLIVGYILTPLSIQFLNFHQGYNLYNVGFTVGIIGMTFTGFARMFGIEIIAVNRVYVGDDHMVSLFLAILFIGMIGYGLVMNQGFHGYGKLLQTSGRVVSDYIVEFSVPLVVLNMGLLGLISIGYVVLSQGVMNGPIVGAILTVVGFGGFGKHPRNVLPILIGVFIATALNIHDPKGTDSILIGLFATTIAPIAGQFGFVAGLVVAAIHDAMAMNIGYLHGGLNLYNNGLSGGFVAAISVPLLDMLAERKRKYEA